MLYQAVLLYQFVMLYQAVLSYQFVMLYQAVLLYQFVMLYQAVLRYQFVMLYRAVLLYPFVMLYQAVLLVWSCERVLVTTSSPARGQRPWMINPCQPSAAAVPIHFTCGSHPLYAQN
jgi:hypothetical protein